MSLLSDGMLSIPRKDSISQRIEENQTDNLLYPYHSLEAKPIYYSQRLYKQAGSE